MNSMDRRYASFVQTESHELVGRQHEFLDQFVCRVMLGDANTLNVSGGIDMNFWFWDLEVDTAGAESFLPE